jgi:hypothetical protein
VWDVPGAGTEQFPQETYIQNMGLRYFDSVVIITAGRFTTTEVKLRSELAEHNVPYFMVRTKVDLDVWNNRLDNSVSDEETLRLIREDLQQHGEDKAYLVSSRDPEKYDMQRLLCDAFPGLRKHMDSLDFIFSSDDKSGWGDTWSLPVLLSQTVSGIQGQWMCEFDGSMYIIDGTEVHVTLQSGQAGVLQLVEKAEGKVWLDRRWYVDMTSVTKARESNELRWTPVDLVLKPLVWAWNG